MIYDIAILGGGPAGYNAAERAAQKGLKVILFEKNKLGGVCLNEGCIPTKTLLYTAKLYDSAKESSKYGLKIENPSFDFKKIMQRKDKVVRKLVGGVGAKMKASKVEVITGNAEISGKTPTTVTISANGSAYECKNLLVATGSEAFIPPIKGLDREKVYTNREILQLKELPKSLIIIGGGVIGMEFGSFFNSMGTEVTIIEMMPEILPGVDEEMSKMLREEYEKKGIKFYLNSKVIEIKGKDVIFEKDGKTNTVSSKKLLVSVGRRANTKDIGLEKIGVELFKGGIKIDKHCRTNIPNVYAAGDVTGFALLAHTAYREGEVAVNNIAGEKDVMRYNANPGVVYTNPEISGVGLTEAEAKKKGIKYKVEQLPMAYAGRFIAENEGKNGFAKIIVGEKYNEILGVHMIGNPSSEMIFGAAMAIETELRLKDIQQVIFPHPTVSEIIRETAFHFNG